jgi:hypothetical protein
MTQQIGKKTHAFRNFTGGTQSVEHGLATRRKRARLDGVGLDRRLLDARGQVLVRSVPHVAVVPAHIHIHMPYPSAPLFRRMPTQINDGRGRADRFKAGAGGGTPVVGAVLVVVSKLEAKDVVHELNCHVVTEHDNLLCSNREREQERERGETSKRLRMCD